MLGLEKLSDWALVLLFALSLAFAIIVNLDPFGYTLGVPNLVFEVLAVALLFLEYREMRERGWL